MKVKESKDLTEAIYASFRQRIEKPRLGIHLSDLLYCNYKSYVRKTNYRLPPLKDEQVILFWSGYAFQYFLKPGLEKLPHSIDGILLSPDLEDVKFGNFYIPLAELKTTRVSMKWFDPSSLKINHYIEQMMGYCHAIKTLGSYLIVFFLLGNYSPPFPQVRTWHYQFTQKEIDDKWNEFLERKAILEKAIAEKKFPVPKFMAFEAECSYCELSSMCPSSGIAKAEIVDPERNKDEI